MTLLYRVPRDGTLFCRACLAGDDMVSAVPLDPALFPGTYPLLCCSSCSASMAAPAVIGGVEVVGSTVRALPTQGGDLLADVRAGVDGVSGPEGPQTDSA